MWNSTRFLVISGTAMAGGSAALIIYRALQEDVEATKKVMNEDKDFWNEKIDELEKVLVELHTKKNGEDNKLIQTIVADVQNNAYFNLKNDGSGFNNKTKSLAQRKTLSDFCRDDSKKLKVDSTIIKKICEKTSLKEE